MDRDKTMEIHCRGMQHCSECVFTNLGRQEHDKGIMYTGFNQRSADEFAI